MQRVMLIRGHKRAIRQLKRKKSLGRTINQLNPSSQACMKCYSNLEQLYDREKEVLSEIGETDSGPKTEKRTQAQKKKSAYRSFNDDYCREYFSTLAVQQHYRLYIEYLFADPEPAFLCKKFKLRCCKSDEHSPRCTRLWEEMKEYMQTGVLEELNITIPMQTPV